MERRDGPITVSEYSNIIDGLNALSARVEYLIELLERQPQPLEAIDGETLTVERSSTSMHISIIPGS